jgi:hypothetical protein
MKKTVGLGVVLSMLCAARAADYWIAPAGNDAGAGTEAEPFATPDRARLAVRDLKRKEPARNRPVVVRVRGGTYYLSQPLTFAPEDSGTSAAPVVYEAVPGEEPVLSAGHLVTGWTRAADGRWRARLPGAENSGWIFSQLYVNDQRRFRPVWPRQGYAFVAAAAPVAPNVCPNQFVYADGDISEAGRR